MSYFEACKVFAKENEKEMQQISLDMDMLMKAQVIYFVVVRICEKEQTLIVNWKYKTFPSPEKGVHTIRYGT
jgi:hypothetical protein